MSALSSVRDLSIGFGTGNSVVTNVNFDVEAGQTLALVGESGCGKTTLLRMIAGFEDITAGEILLRERAEGFDRGSCELRDDQGRLGGLLVLATRTGP